MKLNFNALREANLTRYIMSNKSLIAAVIGSIILVWFLGYCCVVPRMTFDEAISILEPEGFYIITLCHRLGPQKFLIMLGKGVQVYQGKGDSMIECLNEAMDNCARGLVYPGKDVRNRVAANLYTAKGNRVGLDEKMKEMGWELT